MRFIRALLLAGETATDTEAAVDKEDIQQVALDAYKTFKGIIDVVLPIALGVVLLVGTVFAIVLGVNYSKAEKADDRKAAKERLVGAVVGFVITLVIIAVIYAVLSADFVRKMFPGQN